MTGLSPSGREQLLAGASDLGLALDREQFDGLADYGAWMLLEGRKRGVTALGQEEDAVRELLVDSLAAASRLPAGRVADLGSGGGVPGIPLALVCPETLWVLVEASQRKADWLREVVERYGLAERVEVQARRAEDLGRVPGFRGCLQAVVSKALAPMPVLVELALPLLEVGGRLFAYKGPALEEELARAGRALAELGAGGVEEVRYRAGDRQRRLCVVKKAEVTPERYPRRAGVPERKPL